MVFGRTTPPSRFGGSSTTSSQSPYQQQQYSGSHSSGLSLSEQGMQQQQLHLPQPHSQQHHLHPSSLSSSRYTTSDEGSDVRDVPDIVAVASPKRSQLQYPPASMYASPPPHHPILNQSRKQTAEEEETTLTTKEEAQQQQQEASWYDYFFGSTTEQREATAAQPNDETQREPPLADGGPSPLLHKPNTSTNIVIGAGITTTTPTTADQETREGAEGATDSPLQESLLPTWLSWLDPSGSTTQNSSTASTDASTTTDPQFALRLATSAHGIPSADRNTGEILGSLSAISHLPHNLANKNVKSSSTPTNQNDDDGGDDDEMVQILRSDPSPKPRSSPLDPPECGVEATCLMEEGSVTSSVDESKLFHDLSSIPSTRVGTNSTVQSSIKTSDLDLQDVTSTTNSINVGSVVDSKLRAVQQLQQQGQGRSSSTGLASTDTTNNQVTEVQSLEHRRQILVQELRTVMSTHGRYDVQAANISAALGDLLDESGQHEQAIKLHRDAVEIYSTKLGDDHSTTINAKVSLGKVLEHAGQYDEAINIYFLVTVMRRALEGDSDPSAADSLVLMASALRKKDDYHQAIKELKRALKIYRESLGDAHDKVSATVDEIASLYVTIGDFEKSAAILEEVVKLKAATQGINSKAVATTLSNLATAYECSEEFTKSMKSLKKAYKIYTELEGYSSKDATNTLNRIAQLYEATNDHDRASIAYLGVLRGRKFNFGDDSLFVAETYYKLGHSLRESGQLDKALKCLKEGLPIFVNRGVQLHDVEMIAEVMHEMALINKEKKRFSEASRIFKQELGVRRKIGQPDYPMVARTLNHLGVTEYEMKNNNKALKHLVEALTIFKDRAENSVECAEVLFNTGLVFESSRNLERALEAYEEAAKIFREHGYSNTHPHLMKADRKIEKLQQAQEA